MYLNSMLQVEAVNRGLDVQSLALLVHLNDNWFLEEVRGIDIQNKYPILFKSSTEVRRAFDSISDKGFVTSNFVSGIMKEMELNKELFAELFTSCQTIIKRAGIKKTTIKDASSPDMLEIVKHYNTFPEMPRPATLTASNKSILNDKLKSLSKDEIMEAIGYADTAKWIKGKLEERWLNMNWILRNIEGFIEGGKYRTGVQQTRVDNYSKSDIDDIVVF